MGVLIKSSDGPLLLKAERDHEGGEGCGGREAERILKPYERFILNQWAQERAAHPNDPNLDLQVTVKTKTALEEPEILFEYRMQSMFRPPKAAAEYLGTPGNRPPYRDHIWCYLVREGQGCILTWGGPKGT